ncbi:MAG: FAD-dependent oxidoreductase [Candidatus Pacebacteria bacterium]|jgi:thioredoxin-disulfide reductase|nr:FAD-dependent oxidoreductase [Candidatus Paceibacterota bacterium]
MDRNYELIIIGGGPAGIAAGIYAARRKIKTVLVTKSFGGQMVRKSVAIENYPGFKSISGADLVQSMVEQLKENGMEIINDKAGRVKKEGSGFLVKTENSGELSASAVIVATGADPRPLEVEGEKEFIGKGVSYCTTCDAPLFADKDVAVIGGGNSGFESALSMRKYANKVYILEASGEVKADEANRKKVEENPKIEVITSAAVKKIEGAQFVESLIYEDKKTGEEKTLRLQGIFVEIGNVPATGFIKDLVDFNERDEIKIDHRTCQTRTPGIFAAGDATDVKYKQIIIACGQGTTALLSAADYLDKINSDVQ